MNYLFLPNDAYAFKIGILVLAFSEMAGQDRNEKTRLQTYIYIPTQRALDTT